MSHAATKPGRSGAISVSRARCTFSAARRSCLCRASCGDEFGGSTLPLALVFASCGADADRLHVSIVSCELSLRSCQLSFPIPVQPVSYSSIARVNPCPTRVHNSFTTSSHDTPNFCDSLHVLVGTGCTRIQAALLAITVLAEAARKARRCARLGRHGVARRLACMHAWGCPRRTRKACVPLPTPCMCGMHGVGQGFYRAPALECTQDSNAST